MNKRKPSCLLVGWRKWLGCQGNDCTNCRERHFRSRSTTSKLADPSIQKTCNKYALKFDGATAASTASQFCFTQKDTGQHRREHVQTSRSLDQSVPGSIGSLMVSRPLGCSPSRTTKLLLRSAKPAPMASTAWISRKSCGLCFSRSSVRTVEITSGNNCPYLPSLPSTVSSSCQIHGVKQ